MYDGPRKSGSLAEDQTASRLLAMGGDLSWILSIKDRSRKCSTHVLFSSFCFFICRCFLLLDTEDNVSQVVLNRVQSRLPLLFIFILDPRELLLILCLRGYPTGGIRCSSLSCVAVVQFSFVFASQRMLEPCLRTGSARANFESEKTRESSRRRKISQIVEEKNRCFVHDA